MNATGQNPLLDDFASGTVAKTGEDTLRLIAHLPAPDGLEDRVQAGLRTASRRARVLAWPAALHPGSDWVRGAAAAAIVFVVVGGGWGVYTRVQQPQPARVIAMPPRAAAPGSFSSAGAVRTPTTLNGPVLAHPVAGEAKAPAQPEQKPNRHAQVQAAKKTAGKAAAPAAK